MLSVAHPKAQTERPSQQSSQRQQGEKGVCEPPKRSFPKPSVWAPQQRLLTCHFLEGSEVDVVLGHLLEQLICGDRGERGCPQCPTSTHSRSRHRYGMVLLTHILSSLAGSLKQLCLHL